MALKHDYVFADFIASSKHTSQLVQFYFTGLHETTPEYGEFANNLLILAIGLEQINDEGQNENSVIFDDNDDDDYSAVLDVVNRIGDFKQTLFDLDKLLRKLWSENRGRGNVWEKLKRSEDVVEVRRLQVLVKQHARMIQKTLNRKIQM